MPLEKIAYNKLAHQKINLNSDEVKNEKNIFIIIFIYFGFMCA